MAVLGQIRQRSVFLILVIGMALFAFVISGVFDGNSGSSRGGASHHFYTQASSNINYAAMYGSTAASNGNFTDSHLVDGCGVAGDLA